MDAHPPRLEVSHAPIAVARTVRRFASIFAIALALPLLAGCAGNRGSQPPPGMTAMKAPASAVISPGDTLRISFQKIPELNQVQRVRADGRVSLLQIGSVKAAGKSLDAFQSELASRYELKTAGDVIVSLEATHLAVYVTGAVGRPGKVLLDRPMTLLEAIMESGGFERSIANLKKVSLTRSVNGRYTTRWIDLRNPAAGGEYVQAYDMIEVGRFFH